MNNQIHGLTIKAMQNALGQWGVWWGVEGKATKLAYLRFFKTKGIAEKWAHKFEKKLLG